MGRKIRALVVLLALLHPIVPGRAAPTDEIPQVDQSVALSAPRPEYPYEARKNFLTGTGIAVLNVDSPSGVVTSVEMRPARANRSWIARPSALSANGASNLGQ